MAGRGRRSGRDQRRRSLGQNFLVDQRLISTFIAELQVNDDELVVDLGAGTGALSIPLARAGARVWSVERDPVWADRLRDSAAANGVDDRVRLIRADLRRIRFPKEPFRVVANPPFNLTTITLGMLFDNPASPLMRADLILQREVARKHAAAPPHTLKTGTWAPWWHFSLGRTFPAAAFRPRPSIDAAVLHVVRRDPPILPAWLADDFGPLLRSAWQPPH